MERQVMNWYKWSESEGRDPGTMSEEESILFSKVFGNYIKAPEEMLPIKRLVSSGYAPLAFSRSIRAGRKPWGLGGAAHGPLEVAEAIIRSDSKNNIGVGTSFYPQGISFLAQTHEETKRNIVGWYMETYMPALFQSEQMQWYPGGSVPTFLNRRALNKVIESKHLTSEMVRNFWEEDRLGRETASSASREFRGYHSAWMGRKLIYRLFLKSPAMPEDIQVEIAELCGLDSESLVSLISNPNASGDVIRVEMRRPVGLPPLVAMDIRRTFSRIKSSKNPNISDSLAEAMSEWMVSTLRISSNTVPLEKKYEKASLLEYLYGLAALTKSTKAMENLWDFVKKAGGMEENQGSIEPLKEGHIFTAYSTSSQTMQMVKMLAPFIVNHKTTSQATLQKILTYICSIDDANLNKDEMTSKFFGYDTLGLLYTAYADYGVGDQGSSIYHKEGTDTSKHAEETYQALKEGFLKMDYNEFRAYAKAKGISPLKIYKERMGNLYIRMGRTRTNLN
jgi:hypothetical protein